MSLLSKSTSSEKNKSPNNIFERICNSINYINKIAGAANEDTAVAAAPAKPAFLIKSRRFKFFFIMCLQKKYV